MRLAGEDAVRLAVAALAAGACSLVCGVVVRRLAPMINLVDVPNERSLHVRPTPSGGGIGIVLGIVGAVVALFPTGASLSRPLCVGIVGGGLLVAGVSVVDDVRPLSATVRLAAHVAAAAIAVYYIGPISLVHLSYYITFGPLFGTLISLLWVVGLINTYNFMDGIDGIAGGQSIVVAAGLVLVGFVGSEQDFVVAGTIVLGASAGFLAHNWPPARLFMGDVGSAFLGYVIAVVILAGAKANPALGPAGVALSWPFVFDTSWTLLRRLRLRENVFNAHRSHLYQRMVVAGFGHAPVTALYLLLAFPAAGAAVAALVFPSAAMLTLLAYLLLSAVVMVGLVWRYEAGAPPPCSVTPT